MKFESLNQEETNKISGGIKNEHFDGGKAGIWRPKCPKCGKEMPGGIGVKRVDNTIYAHPYFCETCADSLTDKEKNIKPNLDPIKTNDI